MESKKNREIERKFLVKKENIPSLQQKNYMNIIQGYVQNIGGSYFYRLRQVLHMSSDGFNLGEQYFQTIKGFGTKIREEYEIELLKPQYYQLCPLCKEMTVHKNRYEINLDDNIKIAYLDLYKNELNGLITVEVEFETEEMCDSFNPPEWFGEEVTHDKSYTNFNLSLYGLPKK